MSLTGSEGLLKQLTKTVLETALNQEMTEHLGITSTAGGQSLPWSQVSARRNPAGSAVKAAISASATRAAACPCGKGTSTA